MDALTTPALILLNRYRKESRLTQQQYKTIRGQILKGDTDGALRGLQKLLKRGNENERPIKRSDPRLR